MDCATDVRTAVDDVALERFVAALQGSGGTVLVAVVGAKPATVRRAIDGRSVVYALDRPPDAPLPDIAASLYAPPGRCVLVVRPGPDGWDLAVSGRAISASAPSAPDPVPTLRIDRRVVGHALLGELIGGFAGSVAGAGVGILWAAANPGDDDLGYLLAPMTIGYPVGVTAGAIVGAATGTPTAKPRAVAGALVGTAVSFGLLAATFQRDVDPAVWWIVAPAIVLAPPLGAGISVGTAGQATTAVVTARW